MTRANDVYSLGFYSWLQSTPSVEHPLSVQHVWLGLYFTHCVFRLLSRQQTRGFRRQLDVILRVKTKCHPAYRTE